MHTRNSSVKEFLFDLDFMVSYLAQFSQTTAKVDRDRS